MDHTVYNVINIINLSVTMVCNLLDNIYISITDAYSIVDCLSKTQYYLSKKSKLNHKIKLKKDINILIPFLEWQWRIWILFSLTSIRTKLSHTVTLWWCLNYSKILCRNYSWNLKNEIYLFQYTTNVINFYIRL